MSVIWIYSFLSSHKSTDEWLTSIILICFLAIVVFVRLKLFDEKSYGGGVIEPLVALVLFLISFTVRNRTVQTEIKTQKNKKNKKVKKGRLEGSDDNTKNLGSWELVEMVFKQIEEERRGKQQSKMSKKKKRFADLDRDPIGQPKEFTTYYPILDSYSKLTMSDRQIYEELLPLTLDYQDLVQNNYPSDEPGLFFWPKLLPIEEINRICTRCKLPFQIGQSDVYSAAHNGCYYHPRKPQGKPRKYSCCEQGLDTKGCQFSDYHVTDTMKYPRPLVKTKPKKHLKETEQFRVFGLDCEMSYTTNGLEVTKVCVIGVNGIPIYNTFVKPEHKILDYNTFYSGVTASDLRDVPVTLNDVQAYLLKLFNKDSIIIGHSLNCDFAVLGLIHSKVVDTSVIYRKRHNLHQKPSLKELAKDYLQNNIQDGTKGHDCVVDARTSLELVFKKIENIAAPCPQTVSSCATQAPSPKLGTPYTLFPKVISRSTQASSPITVSSDADAHYEIFKHRIDEIIKKKSLQENEDKENKTPLVFMPTLILSQNYTNATSFQPCGQRFVY